MAVQKLGRLPKTSERKRFGLNFSKRRYSTLQAFIDEATRRGVIPSPKAAAPRKQTVPAAPVVPFPREAAATLVAATAQAVQSRGIPPIPAQTRRRKWKRTGVVGFPYAPQDEEGVVALFAILCHQGIIKWQIIDLNSGRGIDATCYDEASGREIKVELKHTLSKASWNHAFEDLDYIVCWENRWPDFPKPVVELERLLQ